METALVCYSIVSSIVIVLGCRFLARERAWRRLCDEAFRSKQEPVLVTIIPGPHVHVFDTGVHPIFVEDAAMLFCSEPGCWASRIIELKERVG